MTAVKKNCITLLLALLSIQGIARAQDCIGLLHPNETLEQISSPTKRVRFLYEKDLCSAYCAASRLRAVLREKSIRTTEISISNSAGHKIPDAFDVVVRIFGLDYAILMVEKYGKLYESITRSLLDPKERAEIVALFRGYARRKPELADRINRFADELENVENLRAGVPAILFFQKLGGVQFSDETAARKIFQLTHYDAE